jgi:hypothetical protein
MPKYRSVLVVDGPLPPFHALVLDEMTEEGWQVYSEGGWFRRSEEWVQEKTVLVKDSHVSKLLRELRGRGVELEKQTLEVLHGSGNSQ